MNNKEITKYVNILQRFGLSSKEALQFESSFKDDIPMQNRIKNIKRLFVRRK